MESFYRAGLRKIYKCIEFDVDNLQQSFRKQKDLAHCYCFSLAVTWLNSFDFPNSKIDMIGYTCRDILKMIREILNNFTFVL